MRYNLRNTQAKLSKCDGVEFCTSRDPSSLPDFFQRFLDVEASGWKGPGGARTAIKLHPSLTCFYAQLADQFGKDGNCEISFLKVDGEFVAGQFMLIAGDVTYVLKIGYDEKYRKLGPGNLLEAHTNNRLHAEGRIREVNFVTGAAWHSSWRPTKHRVFLSCAYNSTPLGKLLFAYDNARRMIATWRNSIERSAHPYLPRLHLTR